MGSRLRARAAAAAADDEGIEWRRSGGRTIARRTSGGRAGGERSSVYNVAAAPC